MCSSLPPLLAAADAVKTLLDPVYIFLLAGFVGFLVITKVPPLLHTPLMSATNAISAISVVAAMIVAGRAIPLEEGGYSQFARILGIIAVAFAMTNVVGGFMITQRMLKMFKRDPKSAPAKKTRLH